MEAKLGDVICVVVVSEKNAATGGDYDISPDADYDACMILEPEGEAAETRQGRRMTLRRTARRQPPLGLRREHASHTGSGLGSSGVVRDDFKCCTAIWVTD